MNDDTLTDPEATKAKWHMWALKLVICVVLDLLDFTIGRLTGFGTIFDVLLTGAAVVMFGWPGLVSIWEVVDVTDQGDGFIPTLTILALARRPKGKPSF